MYNTYIQNGVFIRPNVIAQGDTATVTYKGLLFNSGADTVYMHCGYGVNWENVEDVQMTKTVEGFQASLPINQYKPLNMVFKDSANNWDNNSGKNYTFDVQSG